MTEYSIGFEVIINYKLGNAVDFVFAFVNSDFILWVRNYVEFTCLNFFLE